MLSNKNIITLLNLPLVGKATAYKIINSTSKEFKNPHDYIKYFSSNPVSKRLKNLKLSDIKDAEKKSKEIIKNSKSYGIKILCINDKSFPLRLKEIKDPPVVIFAKGNLKILDSKIAIAVVGTRTPSKYGRTKALNVGEYLAKKNITLVSGLALGCDAEAQIGCVNNKGKTIAVLAHGLDTISPKTHTSLAEKILSLDGCLLSEYQLGEVPQKSNFIRRNRIQSGLSNGVIVIETGESGGTMKTVEFSKKQNRPVFCIKPPRNSKKEVFAKGNAKLIKDGSAQGINDQNDIDQIIKNLKENAKKKDNCNSDLKKISQMIFEYE